MKRLRLALLLIMPVGCVLAFGVTAWAVPPTIEAHEVNSSGTASATLTCNKPTGVTSGDLLVLICTNEDASSTPQFWDNKTGWNTYTRDFVPYTGNRNHPRSCRVMLYAYLRPGVVYWDDVVIKKIKDAPKR